MPALATNGMRMTGFGAVQNGMGGVGTALTLDIVHHRHQPGRPLRPGPPARRVGHLVRSRPSTTRSPSHSLPGPTQTSNRGGSVIPTLGLVLPLGDGLSLGLGAFGIAGMGVDYDADLFGSPLVTSYQQLRVAPARRLEDGRLLGRPGRQPGLGEDELRRRLRPWATPLTTRQLASATAPRSASSSRRPRPSRSASPTRPRPPSRTSSSTSAPPATDKLKFDQPGVLAGGVAWQASPAWRSPSTSSGSSGRPPTARTSPSTSAGRRPAALAFNLDWSDQVVFKVGAEYAVNDGLKVRAGYNYGKKPLNADQAFETSPSRPSPSTTSRSASAGTPPRPWPSTWPAPTRRSRRISGAKLTSPPAPVTYTTSMSQYAVDLGVGWRF